jgi:hypothetical protein
MKIFTEVRRERKLRNTKKLERIFMKGTSFKPVLIRTVYRREWEIHNEVLLKLFFNIFHYLPVKVIRHSNRNLFRIKCKIKAKLSVWALCKHKRQGADIYR